MKTSTLEVLSRAEVEQIHSASLRVLANTGIKVEYGAARRIFREAGAAVNDDTQVVRLSEDLVMGAIAKAPGEFVLHGYDPSFQLTIGGEHVNFAGLGTPTHILDNDTGTKRPATLSDLERHIQLIEACRYVHSTQMDIWPADIPMTTIHSEAITAWTKFSHKPFGMGCYGYLPTLDMMRMIALVAGGKEALRRQPRFFAICSVVSPLQMNQQQAEGLLICADYGQPVTCAPEAIAGATAPATLAGLLVQENAAILAHLALAQLFRPGAPVLYGTVSTIANMRLGTVALGAMETGLITAGSAQMARYYGLPCRSVGAATEAKVADIQAGTERTGTLLAAVMAGVNYITCAGTLDSTMLESEALLLLDDELCGAALRLARGIEVNDETLAVELIERLGAGGNYFAEDHTVRHFRREHYLPSLAVREPYETWEKGGRRDALDKATERVREITGKAKARELEPGLAAELEAYRKMVAGRSMEEFYAYEVEERQELERL